MTLTRKESAEHTRSKIVHAAYDIIGESGFDALTSNLLIQQAGVAKGTLYHHFNNLEEVTFAVIESTLECLFDEVPADQFNSMADYLQALGEFNIESCANNTKIMNIIFGFLPKGMNDPEFKELADELLKRAFAKIAPVIKQFYKGRVSDERIDEAIRMIDMFSTGFVVHFRILGNLKAHRRLWLSFSEMLVSHLDS